MISAINSRSPGLGQFMRATIQSVGGQRVTATFPSFIRPKDPEEEAENFPECLPAFAFSIQSKKISIGQGKKVFNLTDHLFNNKNQAISGIGGN